jgi:O-antigen/teichoic acid export membrane protein
MLNFLKQAFWTSLITNISSVASFIGIAFLARYISPETFGIYIFCLAAKEIISSICAPSLSQTYLFSNGTLSDFKNVCKINSLYSFLILIVSIIGAFIIEEKYGNLFFNIIIIFGILSILNNYSSLFLSIGEKKMNFKKTSFIRSSSQIMSLVLTCLFAIFLGDNLIVLVIKEIIFSCLLFLISLTFYLKFKNEKKIKSKDNLKYLFKYSLRSYFPRVTETFSYKIFDLFMAGFLGKNILGLFNQTLNIVKIPYKFLGSITDNILFVHIKNNKKKEIINDFNLIQNLIILFTIPIILFINLFDYEIVSIILGEKWLKSADMIGLLSIFLIILPFYNSLITVYQSSDNQRYYTSANCLVLFFQILGVLTLPKSIDIFILIYCTSFLLGTVFLSFNINKNIGFDRKKLLNILLSIITTISLIVSYYYLKLNICLFILIFIWIYLLMKNKTVFLLIMKKWKN